MNLEQVINLCVTGQFLAGQPQRAKLLGPAVITLAAERFDGSHWGEQTQNLPTRNKSIILFLYVFCILTQIPKENIILMHYFSKQLGFFYYYYYLETVEY